MSNLDSKNIAIIAVVISIIALGYTAMIPGPAGEAGQQGIQGAQGTQGSQGATGAAGAAGTSVDASDLESLIQETVDELVEDRLLMHALDDQYLSNAGDFVSAADWDSMVTVTVEMDEYSYDSNDLTFVAGTPYKLEIVNVGDSKHYFTAEKFFRSIALRKAQTSEGEFKAPYMKAVEVFPGDQVDIYFVAVLTGLYESVCPIPGHTEAGMTGHITVTGSTPTYPVPTLAEVSDGDWVQNAGDLVSAADWDSMIDVTIELDEYSFSPSTVELKVNQPYRLQVINNGDVKHYFTAEDFYRTAAFRKAQDGSGELKAPFFKAIELFPGEQIDLYLIPTAAGTYDSVCTIGGHEAAGMSGSIVVTP